MSIGASISSGIGTGAMFGLVAAVASLLMGPPLYLAIIPTLAAGSLLGAAAGGVLGASSHMLIHSIPGLRHTMGVSKEGNRAAQLPKVDYAAKKPIVSQTDYMAQVDRVRDDWVDRLEAERSTQDQQIGR